MPKAKAGTGRKVTKLPLERGRDVNKMASAVLRRVMELAEAEPAKNPAAVALGRAGGLKGGRARMDSMTPEERKKLAAKAAKARWSAKK
jgi:hypothetical protein